MNIQKQPKKYILSLELSILDDLGINLYSNVPSVLSEVVANAWDADASVVTIDFNKEDQSIVITDDGHGMSEADINGKYLKVGYKRRKSGHAMTPSGRNVMGRKGIGKLSLFSIADTIEVKSVKTEKATSDKNGLIMHTKAIRKKIEEGGSYNPDVIPEEEIDIEKGTKITIRDLKNKKFEFNASLRARLARRFSIIGKENNFAVFVDGKEISITDRDYFSKVQYLWSIGDVGTKYRDLCTNVEDERSCNISGVINTEKGYAISGWIATVDKHKNIEEENNSIVVLARGKLIHEDILKDIKEGGLFTKYIIGEIHADFVDLDEEDDMATSDRQNLKEDDPRFEELKNFIQTKILKEIQKNWQKWRSEDGEKEALSNPAIEAWFKKLKGDRQKYARKLFNVIGSIHIENPSDKKELYKNGILAFERLALKDMLSTLDNVSTEKDFNLLQSIFAGIDEIEAFEFYNITTGRLSIINKFEKLVPDSKERAIQQYLFEHLWLLDPSWDRASDNAQMEQTIAKDFKSKETLTQEEKDARYDIAFKTYAGKHILIELKKFDANVTAAKLVAQVGKYRRTLEKCIIENYPGSSMPPIEIICVVAKPPLPKEDLQTTIEHLKLEKARFITYSELLTNTKNHYKEYLEKQTEISEIQKLIDKI